MNDILFGSEYCSSTNQTEREEKIRMLEYASYLAVDQFNGYGEEKLEYLKDAKVKKLPTLEDIDFSSNSTHRKNTHLGWNYSYPIEKGKKHDVANWAVRKNILRATANKIFKFGFFKELFGRYCTENDAFCELVYYAHIQGDHQDAEKLSDLEYLIPFACCDQNESNPDVMSELVATLTILFDSCTDSYSFIDMINELTIVSEQARQLDERIHLNDSEELFEEYQQNVGNVIDILTDHVPGMLKNLDFFSDAFY